MTELCERFGVSRKTGYKWVRRFEALGAEGLEDRLVRRSAVRTGCRIGSRRRSWPPRPAPRRAGALLAREGLVRPRRRRRRPRHPGRPRIEAREANDVWTADFKGQFRTKDWDWCYPLTIADRHSRYLRIEPGHPEQNGAHERMHCTLRTRDGSFVFHRQPIYLSTALRRQPIGLEETDAGIWSVYLCDVLLGRYDEREPKVYP